MAVRQRILGLVCAVAMVACIPGVHGDDAEKVARTLLRQSGVKGGVVIHLGCNGGELTAALGAEKGYQVHGLDTDAEDVQRARKHIHSANAYGPVSVAEWGGESLPYIDNMVNLLVAESPVSVSNQEILRVLRPHGVALIKKGEKWTKTVKPWPKEMDEWTHYLHDSSGNAVSQDTRVGPPEGLQWVGSPRWGRHHDHMASMNAMVSAQGRVFYVMDRGSRKSILLPSDWYLVARDAFNGTILWERSLDGWHTPLWPLKSGPSQLPRRVVAVGDTVYAVMGEDGPVAALDAATGRTIRTYPNTDEAEELLVSDGILYVVADAALDEGEYMTAREVTNRVVNKPWWSGNPSRLMALNAANGETVWSRKEKVVPLTLAVKDDRLCYHDGERIQCRDAGTGSEIWSSPPVKRASKIFSFFGPTLVMHKDVVLFAGGEVAGQQFDNVHRVKSDEDHITALSLEDGEVMWSASHPASGYRSPEDVFGIENTVWFGESAVGGLTGIMTGRDIHSGELKKQFAPDVETYWFHHRCYRGKATCKYLLMSRTGIEYVDPEAEHWDINHWVRSSCLYGVMPANGLTYAGPHDCACYIVAKQYGFNALSPEPAVPEAMLKDVSDKERLVKGPAYGESLGRSAGKDTWPTYRQDAERSGCLDRKISADLASGWDTDLGGELTSMVADGGKIFVACKDSHTVHCLDAGSGEPVWRFIAGGRVDSPPTIWKGRAIFGCADGRVYCLRASDGKLVWKFRAAPVDRRMCAWEDVQSVWPVHGSVLIKDGIVHCVAGRSAFLDGGIRYLRLDAKTGKKLSENVMDGQDPTTGDTLQAKVKGLNMPPALPDILSNKGDRVYMRSQEFDLKGHRTEVRRPQREENQQGPAAHLLAPTGFLDGSWFHRSYWFYGKTPLSGAGGYYRAGRHAAGGRIMVLDDSTVYSYGREPQYFRWTTPMEYHLFAAPKQPTDEDRKSSMIEVPKSDSLDPTGTPLTVEAWIRPEKGDGVVVARGGAIHGYTLYLDGGRPMFALRVDEKIESVSASDRVSMDEWVHLAGVATPDKKLLIYVNGKLAGEAETSGFIVSNPGESMQIGADGKGSVGDYRSPLAFSGNIDEVRIYEGAVDQSGIREDMESAERTEASGAKLVLYYSFDKGKAKDLSGKSNDGQIGDVKTVAGKFGRAVRFAGIVKPGFYEVPFDWTRKVPLHARGMVLAGDTLFMAGPPDLVDEEEAVASIGRSSTQRKLRRQDAAWNGKHGGVLWAVSKRDGKKLAERRLDSYPVWDGMIASEGRLYIATRSGHVICLNARE